MAGGTAADYFSAMQKKPPVSQEICLGTLHRLLHYESETGKFTWLVDRRAASAGTVAGRIEEGRHYVVTILGWRLKGRNLAWAMTYGHWPSGPVEHINGDRLDNRISNLRIAATKDDESKMSVCLDA